MKNCLVTKLKGVIDNSDLVKLGEFKFHVKNNDSTTICPLSLISSENFRVEVSSPGFLYKGTIANPTDITSTFEGNDTSGYKLSQGEYDVSVISKYGLTSVSINSTLAAVIDVDIKEFTYCNLGTLILSSSGITGKTSDFLDFKYLPVGSANVVILIRTSLIGDIANIGKCLNMENHKYIIANADTRPVWSNDSDKPTGTIEGFVENLNPVNYSKNFKFMTYINVTFHGLVTTQLPGSELTAVNVSVDASGNATVHKLNDASIIYGNYTKSTDTWSYS